MERGLCRGNSTNVIVFGCSISALSLGPLSSAHDSIVSTCGALCIVTAVSLYILQPFDALLELFAVFGLV